MFLLLVSVTQIPRRVRVYVPILSILGGFYLGACGGGDENGPDHAITGGALGDSSTRSTVGGDGAQTSSSSKSAKGNGNSGNSKTSSEHSKGGSSDSFTAGSNGSRGDAGGRNSAGGSNAPGDRTRNIGGTRSAGSTNANGGRNNPTGGRTGLGGTTAAGGRATGGSSSSFRFVAMADTQGCSERLTDFSKQIAGLSPKPDFALFIGDLVDHWDKAAMDEWVSMLNGGSTPGNRLQETTFLVRGGHDACSEDDCESAVREGYADYLAKIDYSIASVATRIGAVNLVTRSHPRDPKNIDYSFDYGNAHFIGIDAVNEEGSDTVTDDQVAWVDADLTAAEQRPLTHAFLFFHRAIYTVGKNCCSQRIELAEMLGRHPIVTAVFNGHEHTYAHTLLTADRLGGSVSVPIHQFVAGTVGCGCKEDTEPDEATYSECDCESGRTDVCVTEEGFLLVEVDGANATVLWRNKTGTAPANTTVCITK